MTIYPKTSTAEAVVLVDYGYYRTLESSEPVSVQIVSVLGQVLKQMEFSRGGELRIDLDGLAAGNYVFRAIQGHRSQTTHLFKK